MIVVVAIYELPLFLNLFFHSLPPPPAPASPSPPVDFEYSIQVRKLNSQSVIGDTQVVLPTSRTNWEIFRQQVIKALELASSPMDQSVPAKNH